MYKDYDTTIELWKTWYERLIELAERSTEDHLKKQNTILLLQTVYFQFIAIDEIIKRRHAPVACGPLRTYHEHLALLAIICLAEPDNQIQCDFYNSRSPEKEEEFYRNYVRGQHIPTRLSQLHKIKRKTSKRLTAPIDYVKLSKMVKNEYGKYVHPSLNGTLDITFNMRNIRDMKALNLEVVESAGGSADFMKKLEQGSIARESSIVRSFLHISASYSRTVGLCLDDSEKMFQDSQLLLAATFHFTHSIKPEHNSHT